MTTTDYQRLAKALGVAHIKIEPGLGIPRKGQPTIYGCVIATGQLKATGQLIRLSLKATKHPTARTRRRNARRIAIAGSHGLLTNQ